MRGPTAYSDALLAALYGGAAEALSFLVAAALRVSRAAHEKLGPEWPPPEALLAMQVCFGSPAPWAWM